MSQATSLGVTTIDGIEFEAYPLDPWISLEIMEEIAAIVGPALGDLAGAIAGGDIKAIKEAAASGEWGGGKVNADYVASGVAGLFLRTKSANTRKVIEQLAAVTTVKNHGKLGDTFQIVFLGKPGALLAWVAWAIKIQFSSVFGSIPAAIEFLAQRLALGA